MNDTDNDFCTSFLHREISAYNYFLKFLKSPESDS